MEMLTTPTEVSKPHLSHEDETWPFYVGVILAISSTFLIGSGFIFKKKALLRAGACGRRAGECLVMSVFCCIVSAVGANDTLMLQLCSSYAFCRAGCG